MLGIWASHSNPWSPWPGRKRAPFWFLNLRWDSFHAQSAQSYSPVISAHIPKGPESRSAGQDWKALFPQKRSPYLPATCHQHRTGWDPNHTVSTLCGKESLLHLGQDQETVFLRLAARLHLGLILWKHWQMIKRTHKHVSNGSKPMNSNYLGDYASVSTATEFRFLKVNEAWGTLWFILKGSNKECAAKCHVTRCHRASGRKIEMTKTTKDLSPFETEWTPRQSHLNLHLRSLPPQCLINRS